MTDSTETIRFPPLSAAAFAAAMVGIITLFSTRWVGPVFAVISLALAAYAWRRTTDGAGRSMLVMATAFAVITLGICWIGSDLHTILWG